MPLRSSALSATCLARRAGPAEHPPAPLEPTDISLSPDDPLLGYLAGIVFLYYLPLLGIPGLTWLRTDYIANGNNWAGVLFTCAVYVLIALGLNVVIGLAGVALSILLGVVLGGISGYYGGFTDTVIQGQGERGILELRFPYAGKYMFHAHVSEFAELGWMGFFEVEA